MEEERGERIAERERGWVAWEVEVDTCFPMGMERPKRDVEVGRGDRGAQRCVYGKVDSRYWITGMK